MLWSKILAPIYSCVQIYSFGYHNIRLVIIVINFTVYLLRVMIDLKLQITFLGPDQGFSPYTGSKLGIMFQSLQYKKWSIKLIPLIYCGIIIVCGGLQLLWVTLNSQECTCIYKHLIVYSYLFKLSWTGYMYGTNRITTWKILANQEHWPPQMKINPQYIKIRMRSYFFIYTQEGHTLTK